jgi:hypothetical protein
VLTAPPAPVAPRRGGPVQLVTSPFRRAGAAVGERWRDAMREGKLAMRERETEMRAQYERGVDHDPRWHASQHNKSGRSD